MVTPVDVHHAQQMQVAETLYAQLTAAGIEVLLDDHSRTFMPHCPARSLS
ncbi:hypothetical protein EHF33_14240 [Deinococcus psychrotolerans]|uniref:Uncharacterized protein n=1 Tax=Deinococcus psychrotolerans TaxID=2489213 RepID=A0A3G8YN83_9DEIO|nr:hypothetical protein [Deinococcus psychrotolerans]AZI44074.1 hypothetical protein EHF33_14240 [Deinococcus psychrotolerans]